MKKLLALLLVLSMVLALAACGGSSTPETQAPTETAATTEAEETVGVPEFHQYVYVEDRGDFEVTWTFTQVANVYSLDEYNGMSGETTTHGIDEVTDNGDGTITTGAWSDSDSNKSEFFNPNGECTWIITGDSTFEPVNAGEVSSNEGSVNPGQYTFVDGETTWLVKIMGNGGCEIVETNTQTGDEIKTHTVRNYDGEEVAWKDNGNETFETNEWEPEEREDNKPELASPNGVINWKVVDAENNLVEPTEKVETSTIAYGAYHYTDYDGNLWAIMIMGNGDCTIQPNDADGNIIMREEGGPVEYKTNGFRINDDGTFTTFPMQDPTDIPEFLAGTEEGMATWRIVNAENMLVDLVWE